MRALKDKVFCASCFGVFIITLKLLVFFSTLCVQSCKNSFLIHVTNFCWF